MLSIFKWWGGGIVVLIIFAGAMGENPSPLGGFVLLLLLASFFLAPFVEAHLEDKREKKQWLEAERLLEIDDVDEMSGIQFEDYVGTLMENMGYDVKMVRGGSDFGADLIATKDGTRITVQVKRYSRPVPRAAVSDAVGARQHFKCQKAMVVTNNVFAPSSQTFAESTNCILIDRIKLSEWIRNFQKTGDRMR